jgi:hypothetical protein
MHIKKSERSRSRGRSSRPDDEYLKAVLVTSDTSGKLLRTLPCRAPEKPHRILLNHHQHPSPHLKPTKPLISDIIHPHGSAKPHKRKLTAAKSAYLRHILADISPANTSNPFSALLSGVPNVGASAQNGYALWNKFRRYPVLKSL